MKRRTEKQLLCFSVRLAYNILFPFLQMQHAVADFLRPSLVPELGSDIAAGTACNRHLVLVTVAAVRALPDQLTCLILDDFDLTVIAAALAVIALGIQLCIHDVLIDELHDRQDCRDILLHVRHGSQSMPARP